MAKEESGKNQGLGNPQMRRQEDPENMEREELSFKVD